MSVEPAPLLQQADLERFESTLAKVGSTLVERLNPGLPAPRQDAIASELGLRIGPELRTWWGWRDGSADEIAGVADFGDLWIPSLSDAVNHTAEMARIDEEVFGVGSGIWESSWMTILITNDGTIVGDCGAPEGSTTPVTYVPTSDPQPVRCAESLLEVVSFWIESLEEGTISYDRSSGNWGTGEHWSDLPERLKLLT